MYLQLGMVSSAQHTALHARPGIEKEKKHDFAFEAQQGST